MREEQIIPLERKYIEIQYNTATQQFLRGYCEDNGFDLGFDFNGKPADPNNFNFHSTVWFTTSKHQLENKTFKYNDVVSPVGFNLFGEDKNVLVLEIKSVKLNTVRYHYAKTYNMKDEWPDFKPHITLTYKYEGELPDIALPDQNLVADILKIKTQPGF